MICVDAHQYGAKLKIYAPYWCAAIWLTLVEQANMLHRMCWSGSFRFLKNLSQARNLRIINNFFVPTQATWRPGRLHHRCVVKA